MKKIMVTVIAVVLATQAKALTAQENDYLTIKSVSVQEIPDLSPLMEKTMTTDLNMQVTQVIGEDIAPEAVSWLKSEADPVAAFSAELDAIINIGQKIWTIVEKGQPVVNAQLNSASAMPDGIHDWKELTGWKQPRSASYRVHYTNLFNMNVVDFTYRVLFTYGGSLNGQGRFVTGATIVPAQLDVAWGYSFKSVVEIPTVINMGSKENPVAGIQMNVNWVVGTVLKHSESRSSYFVDGNGTLKQMQ
jgi:hypothetical protein